MYGANIKQDSCITTMYKLTCFEPIRGDGLLESRPNNFFLSRWRLIREGWLI